MALADLAGLSLYYEEEGVGRPLLLIAGIPAIASDWGPVAAGLAEAGHRVISYDNRGSGASTVTPGPYTTGELANDAVALLEGGVNSSEILEIGGRFGARFRAAGWGPGLTIQPLSLRDTTGTLPHTRT